VIREKGVFRDDPVCVREKGVSDATYRARESSVVYQIGLGMMGEAEQHKYFHYSPQKFDFFLFFSLYYSQVSMESVTRLLFYYRGLERTMREQELAIVRDTVETLGFILVDAYFQGGRRPSSLTVVIYRQGQDVTSGDCEQVSQVLAQRLAVEVGFDHEYSLVVESPGVDRRLKSPREVEIFRDRPIRLVVKNFQEYGLKDSVVLTRIERVEGDTLVFTHEGKTYHIPWERLNQAKLHFDIKEYLKEEG